MTENTGENTENNNSQALDNKNYRIVIPEKRKTNEVFSRIAPNLPPRKSLQDGGSQTELGNLPELKEQSNEFGEGKAAKMNRQTIRRK